MTAETPPREDTSAGLAEQDPRAQPHLDRAMHLLREAEQCLIPLDARDSDAAERIQAAREEIDAHREGCDDA